MLQITKLSDYALTIMMHFALHTDGKYTKTQVAQATKLPPPTVAKVLKLLRKEGIVSSLQGLNGGYQLHIPLKEISLYKIIMAIDGSKGITDCIDDKNLCDFSNHCHVDSVWNHVNKRVQNILEDVCMDDVLTFYNVQGMYHEQQDHTKKN